MLSVYKQSRVIAFKKNVIEHTFAQRKFNSIFFANFFEMLVGVLLSASDSIIVGRIVGLDGLSAMNLVLPFTTLAVYLTLVISGGSRMVYSRRVGAFQNEEAERAVGLGAVMAAILGICLLLATWFVMPVYVGHSGLTANGMRLALEYLSVYGFCLLLSPFKDLLSEIAYTDGRENVAMIAAITESIGNIIFSIPLGLLLGMRGIALGTVLSNIIAFFILVIWRGEVRFRISFSGQHLKEIILGGAGSDTMFLYLSILGIICNHIVAKWIGVEYFPVLTLLYIIIEMSVLMEIGGEALEPMVTAYFGEKNNPGIRKLMQYAIVFNLVLGVIQAVVYFWAAPVLPYLVDINSNPQLYTSGVMGLRIYAISCVPLGWLAILDTYWLLLEKYKLAFLSNFLKYFACTAVLLPVLVRTLGIMGIWLAFTLGYFISFLIVVCIGFFHYKKEMFPLFLGKSDNTFDYSFVLEQTEIQTVLDLSENFLREKDINQKVIFRILLFIEELLYLTKNKNADKKVYSEICLRVEKTQTILVLWDDGVKFDITEQDGVVSDFRDYFVARIMGTVDRSVHQTITGFNRTGISFNNDEVAKETEETYT